MREIKFMGKCIHSGELVYGDLLHGVKTKKGKVFILPIVDNTASIPYCHPLDGVEVDPKTVGQFTGLTDKNRKEIYEGDIVESDNGSVFVLEWDNEWAKFRCNSNLLGDNGWLHPIEGHGGIETWSVIGNIHQNPDLLK